MHIKDRKDSLHPSWIVLPGQFLRQKKIVSNVLDNRALHVFYHFKHSLHIVKLSSVKTKILWVIPNGDGPCTVFTLISFEGSLFSSEVWIEVLRDRTL
jgi:hypothetical protein